MSEPVRKGVCLRPVVRAFAEAMERKLRANDYKGGWQTDDPIDLLTHAIEEIAELVPLVTCRPKFAVHHLILAALELEDCPPKRKLSARRVRSESSDVANMVMMVADVCHAFEPAPKRKVS